MPVSGIEPHFVGHTTSTLVIPLMMSRRTVSYVSTSAVVVVGMERERAA